MTPSANASATAAAAAGAISDMRVIGFPGRYVQGPGALGLLGSLVIELGGRQPVLVSDDIVEAALRQGVSAAFASAELAPVRLRFGGECTRGAIAALAAQAQEVSADMVIALGGGKTIDTAKGVARALGLKLAVVPTVASNDSPTSRLIVVYDESHQLVGVDYLARNPDLVLVDTAVIAQAPVRFFRAGIGDAISKKFEAAQCLGAGGRNFFGGRPPGLVAVITDRCHAAIVEHGQAALLDVASHRVTPAVEAVTEATVLLSGLGFESGGLSIAHSVLRGFSTVPAMARSLHGEQVAFGLLVQWVLEGRPASALGDMLDLYGRLGLPCHLGMLGYEGEASAIAGPIALHTWHTAPYVRHLDAPVDAGRIEAAILQADQLGRQWR
ncbi:MAG: glycerol dehydrogenase [Rubrivivax sp.]